MRVMSFLFILAGLALLLFGIAWTVNYLAPSNRLSRSDRRQLAEYEEFVDRLREIAYDHRELDSNLSNIITDEIRTFERKKREIS